MLSHPLRLRSIQSSEKLLIIHLYPYNTLQLFTTQALSLGAFPTYFRYIMRVKTLSEPTFQEADIKESTLTEIKEQVDERGFYLYDWISPDELRMSVQADYLRVVKSASIPLAVVSFVMGMIGLIFAGFL